MAKKDQAAEQVRVNHVISLIKKQIKQTIEQITGLEQQTHSIEQTYSGNTRISIDEADDKMETNATVQQQKQLLSNNIEITNILHRKETNLKQAVKSPYFGKLTIQEDSDAPEEIYIGTSSVRDAAENFLIYDWRTPIASMFYNNTVGNAQYTVNENSFDCRILTKRQFVISNGIINKMFDTSETINDDVLKDTLSQTNSTKMSNIVATIQQQQNEIIRDESNAILLINGVAGSGKTSTILQRIAYLLYHQKNKLAANQVLLFSPNYLFSDYISDVLPSLGEERLTQVTLDDFVSYRLTGFNVQDTFTKHERDLHNQSTSYQKINLFKQGMQFKSAIDEYVANLTTLKFNDLAIDQHIIFSSETITKIFAQTNAKLPIRYRFDSLVETLLQKLDQQTHELTQTEWFSLQFNNLGAAKITELSEQAQTTELPLDELYARELIEKLRNTIENHLFFSEYEQYQDFLSQLVIPEVADKSYQEQLIDITSQMENHQLYQVDAPGVLYLRDLITQIGLNKSIREVVIDEMQDYTPFQLAYLKSAFPKAKFSLLGDVNQDVLLPNNKDLASYQTIFPDKKIKLYQLNQSYRSTSSITDFARYFLNAPDSVVTFDRPGTLPKIIVDESVDLNNLTLKINDLAERFNTVAIITRDQQETDQLYARLSMPLNRIDIKSHSLKIGVSILPAYLAKGLEFDVVIAYNVNNDNYHSEQDGDVLYTIATRAMHELIIHQTSLNQKLLAKIPQELYQTT